MNKKNTHPNGMPKYVSFEEVLIRYLQEDCHHAEGFLEAALTDFQEDGNVAAFLPALRHLAKAQGGMTKLSQETHLNRKALYKALSPAGNPRLDTLHAIIKALGFRLSAHLAA